MKAGHEVETVVTSNALRFVGKTSFEALSGKPCHTELFENASEVPHIQLAKTDLVLVAPATASFIAKYANGIADDLLLNILLATKARVVIAPAMHTEMWQHPATVENLEKLRRRGVEFVDPEFGELTSGDIGQGRLAGSDRIIEVALSVAAAPAGRVAERPQRSVVITAGGTREPIDDVRYLGNHSSGLQGIELARAFGLDGWRVSLIGANIGNPKLPGVEFVAVSTHAELKQALASLNPDLLVMCAAVSDFTISPHVGKLSRDQGLKLDLLPTSDIVAEFALTHRDSKVVAFAAEAANGDELLHAGREKLLRKGVAAIVANNLGSIGSVRNQGYVITPVDQRDFSGTKAQCATQILRSLRELNVIA